MRAGAVVALLAAVLPPLEPAARRYDVAESVQFALLALALPALLALGAPLAGLSPTGGRFARFVAALSRTPARP